MSWTSGLQNVARGPVSSASSIRNATFIAPPQIHWVSNPITVLANPPKGSDESSSLRPTVKAIGSETCLLIETKWGTLKNTNAYLPTITPSMC